VGIAGTGTLEERLRFLPGLEVRAVAIWTGALARLNERHHDEQKHGDK
jgi:hypothetical protein